MIAQGTQEWLDQRRGLITCSRLGAILELDSYCKPSQYFDELTGKRKPFKGNRATEWGTEHEPDAIWTWEVENNALARPSGFVRHPTILWLGGSPDGLVGTDMVLETKCPFNRIIPESVPPKYEAQVQGLLEVTGREVGILHYWTPPRVDPYWADAVSNEPHTRSFEIRRDREWWAKAYPKLEQFWEAVQHALKLKELTA